MTSDEFWKSWLAFWIVAGGPGLLALVGLSFSLYLTRRHLDAMKEALKNSRYIYIWGDSLGKRGVIWSLLEMSKIAGMITMPKAYIRLGDLDPVDLENFPPYLKRLLVIVTAMIFTPVIWMVVVAVVLKLK
ncbi:hypothetical protein F0169_19295 [Pseudomonas sp. MAFF 212408]|uniref:Uncharacterized protein n=1 Tax=Pseudomonas kitaguniensis TaxID=2607908 RepID=A0A5N7KR04_9PSED|nr:hypothetical protein [Pseudomonas kitaguniensis]MPR04032.1 hypothetical protein [Pseudomonas kitaguniensis]